MTLFEIGIFNNSHLVYSESFYKLKTQSTQSLNQRSHIINIISKMTEMVYTGSASFLETGKYRVFFFSPKNNTKNTKSNFFIYSIGDRLSEDSIVKKLLVKIGTQFEDIASNRFFSKGVISEDNKQILTKIVHSSLSDEILKPKDRLIRYIFS